jgi:malate synthase
MVANDYRHTEASIQASRHSPIGRVLGCCLPGRAQGKKIRGQYPEIGGKGHAPDPAIAEILLPASVVGAIERISYNYSWVATPGAAEYCASDFEGSNGSAIAG